MIGMQIIVERSAGEDWPPLYYHLRGAFDADEDVPLSFGVIPDRYHGKVLSWDLNRFADHDRERATFHMVTEAPSIIRDGVPSETITRAR